MRLLKLLLLAVAVAMSTGCVATRILDQDGAEYGRPQKGQSCNIHAMRPSVGLVM